MNFLRTKWFNVNLLVLLLIFSSIARADYIVTGASNFGFDSNGTYVLVEDQTYYDKPVYRFVTENSYTGSFFLFYQFNRWNIGPDLMDGFYYAFSPDGEVPATGWFGFDGDEPNMRVEPAAPSLKTNTTVLRENVDVEGQVNGSIEISLSFAGELVFSGTNGDNFIQDNKVTIDNVPQGLAASLVKTSPTTLSLSFAGVAQHHSFSDSVNFSLTFDQSAFNGDASALSSLIINGLQINFIDSVTVGNVRAEFPTLAAAIAESNAQVFVLTSDIVEHATINVNTFYAIKGNGYEISVPVTGLSTAGIFNAEASNFTLFNVASGAELQINSAILKGGAPQFVGGVITASARSNTLIVDSIITQSRARNTGGGAIDNAGVLVINNSALTRNSAAYGGAILNRGSGKVIINASTLTENRSESNNGGGGGIENQGFMVINNTTFSNNFSTEIGGGINNAFSAAKLYVLNSTFSGNVGYGNTRAGGAIGINGSSAVLINNIFAYNYTRSSGTTANPTAFQLSDIERFSGSGEVRAFSNIFHTDLVPFVEQSNNVFYSGAADGSDNTIFSGGIVAKVINGQGQLIGSGTFFAPFLARVDASKAGTLQPGSFILDESNAGVLTALSADANTIGYWNGTAWQNVLGSQSELYPVTVDQLQQPREEPVVRGAVQLTLDNLFFVRALTAVGGSVSGATIYGDVYPLNSVLSIAALPNAGFRFVSWQDEQGQVLSTSANYTFLVTSDLTLQPVFEALPVGTFVVSYLANGATAGNAPTTTEYSDEATISGPGDLQRAGHIFVGWNTISNGAGIFYAEGDVVSERSLTLYAIWQAIESANFSLVYQAGPNGTLQGLTVQTVAEGSSGTEVIAVPDPGYLFAGWSDSVSTAARTDQNVTANLSVSASFTIQTFEVTFVGFDGSALAVVSVNYGSAASAPDAPAVEGYRFTGWSGAFDNVTSDLIITAQYEMLSFTVTFLGFDLSVLSSANVNFGSAAIAPEAPTVAGFEFVGWDSDFSNIRADTTVTAQYAPVDVTPLIVLITYEGQGVLSVEGPQTISPGATISITLTAAQGYELNLNVAGTCPLGEWLNDTYTTPVITESCSLHFVFDEIYKPRRRHLYWRMPASVFIPKL